jgi:hypothetical protein
MRSKYFEQNKDAQILEVFKKKQLTLKHPASFKAFTAGIFQTEFFCVVTPCSVALGYQRFEGPCCLHLQD